MISFLVLSEDPYGLVGKTLAFYAFLLCIDGATIVTDSEVPMYMDRLVTDL